MARRGLDPSPLLDQAFSRGLAGALDAATDVDDFEARLKFAAGYPGLSISAGIHPSSVTENLEVRLSILEKQAGLPEVRAIGETGLDSYRDDSPADLQEQSFRFHLELARDSGKPIIIHNRDADRRVLDMVRDSGCRHGIFHCFSSTAEIAAEALDLGFHISFAGNMTFKSNAHIRSAAAMVPENRLLLETDSPFLSPEPRRGRPNHPGHIGYTLERLAELRKTDPAELANQILENSLDVYRLR